MQGRDFDAAALDEAERAIGGGPVVMVNLLRFRDTPDYPDGFADARPDAASGYYEGYVGGFREASEQVGVASQLLYAGSRVHSLLAGPGDGWDEIAVVRYECFADLRRIMESEIYRQRARPHHLAVIAEWRFFATRSH